jgi:hypothetical protein
MLATGIAVGSRQLYTDDEEHSFSVCRPIVFNGISADLVVRSDLASRTIKLAIPPIPDQERRTEKELQAEFVEMWPRVLGSLLDGLVGALANADRIKIDKPARLADFERWAEAGCRAMGFAEYEFVDAYRANRLGSMEASLHADAVGSAAYRFMQKHPDGFMGMMETLLTKLQTHRRWADKGWPAAPNKLSSALRRLVKPLASVGIAVEFDVDLRDHPVPDERTKRGVVLRWTTR